MGGDSGLFDIESGDCSICKESKVWLYYGFLVGAAGSSMDIQKLQYKLDYKKLRLAWQTRMETPEHWAVKHLTPMLKKEFDCLDDMDCMMGVDGHLFSIQSDFSIIELANKYEAIGRGSEYAVGCLQALDKSNMLPENKVLKALSVAAQYNVFIRSPFTYKTTLDE